MSRFAGRAVVAALVIVCMSASPVMAAFPYDWHYPPGDLDGGERWKYSSKTACQEYGLTPETEAANCDPTVEANPQEQRGVMGASVDRAWGALKDAVPAGQPPIASASPCDGVSSTCPVVIAVHDSGIIWDLTAKTGAFRNVNSKIWLNADELPPPGGSAYDRNSDGVFNIRDYCQNWETPNSCGGGDPNISDLNGNGIIDPEDLIFRYSDGFDGFGSDSENNGYVDDFVGWDAYEDDNDPFDEVHYGHGTGEAFDSTGEAGDGEGGVGTCPNCMVMPMRVGDSFVADTNDFAQGVVYATDNGASIIQSALGTLNNSRFAQEAIDYAYRRGVVLIASAADESAGHHNQPSVLEHGVTMNSIGAPEVPGTRPASYLEFRGCTNFGAYITASVPSDSCSSEAVGRSSGMTGLLYNAARRAVQGGNSPTTCGALGLPACGFQDYGSLDGAGGVPTGRGLSAEEVDQLISTTADDISFTEPAPYTQRPGYSEETRRYGATAGWDPFFGYGRINARRMVKAVLANKVPPEADITSPKWFETVDPDDLGNQPVSVEGSVASRRTAKYSYKVRWATWSWKYGDRDTWRHPAWHDATKPASLPTCDAAGDLCDAYTGALATIDPADISAELAATNIDGGGDSGPAADPATGRGDHENMQLPDKFSVIVQVIVTARNGAGDPITTPYQVEIENPAGGGDPNADQTAQPTPLRGIGTKNFFFHRDPSLFPGYPKDLHGDGGATPRFVDIDDDGQNEMMVAGSNGEIHMFEVAGGETPGWPVTSTDMNLNYGAPAYQSGEITVPVHAAVLRSPSVGDLDRDGDLEVVAGDFMGRVSAWDNKGHMLPGFPVRSNPVYSSPQRADRAAHFYQSHPELVPGDFPGQLHPQASGPSWSQIGLPNDPDLVPDLVNRRISEKIKQGFAGGTDHDANRTFWGFVAAPSLGDLDGTDKELEIVAGSQDRHVYAWNADGTPVTGWESGVMLRDPAKLDSTDSIDKQTHLVRDDDATDHYNAGAIVNSVALGDTNNDAKGFLEVAATVNEEYKETPNTDDSSAIGLCSTIGSEQADVITCGNDRVYQLKHTGSTDTGGGTGANSHPDKDAYRDGWPARIATVYIELLPVVGEGPDGAPVLANTNTTPTLETGIYSTAGPGYIFDDNGVSVYGRDAQGRDRSLLTNAVGPHSNSPDHPALPAVGGAIFSSVGQGRFSFVTGSAGAGKLSDVALPEDQLLSDNQLSAWDTSQPQPGQPGPRNQLPSFPREVNDLQFLATPASADIDGDGTQELLGGTAYYDLHAFDGTTGLEPGLLELAPDGWPKFTGGWTVTPPTVGDFDGDGLRDVAHVIREGRLFVWHGNGAGDCDPATWPEFGHDAWNTNNVETDATRPRVITDLHPEGGTSGTNTLVLTWTAPGDDGVCRQANNYEIRSSSSPLTNENFDQGTLIADKQAGAPGTIETKTVPCNDSFVAVRTWDADKTQQTPAHPANPSAVSDNVHVSSDCIGVVIGPGGETQTPTDSPTQTPTESPTGSPSPTPTNTQGSAGKTHTTIASGQPRTGYRQRFTLSGRVTSDGTCRGPFHVTITKHKPGHDAQAIDGGEVAGNGSWSRSLRSKHSATYSARAEGRGTDCDAMPSRLIKVKVEVRIAIRRARCARYRGGTTSVSGTITPHHHRSSVLLQEKKQGGWETVDSDRAGGDGAFRLTTGYCGRPYRVRWPGHRPGNAATNKRVRQWVVVVR